jgi:iron(III) transport system ATP-binding protein
MCMLQLKGISKKFDGAEVLKKIDMDVGDGEIVSILGPSGSGKTTLLNIILGILDPDDGAIIYNGEDLTHVPMEQRGFNIVFQDYALFPNLNAYGNITYGLKNKPDVSSPKEVDDLIDLLELRDHLQKPIDELSGGQKQRVAIARTLVMKPSILLMDEPLSALDGIIKESIKEKIREVAKRFNLTTIIVTHDPEEALSLSDRVMILGDGQIKQYDKPENIIHHPANAFIEDFILSQLKIKRRNIRTLFNTPKAAEA